MNEADVLSRNFRSYFTKGELRPRFAGRKTISTGHFPTSPSLVDPTATTPTQRVVIVAVRTDEKLLEVRAIDVTRVGATATKAIGDEAKAKMGWVMHG